MPSQIAIEDPLATDHDTIIVVERNSNYRSAGNEEETSRPTEQENDVCNTRQAARMGVSLFVGLLLGWCVAGVVALVDTKADEIRNICYTCELWELLFTMVIVNLLSTIVLVHIWFNYHFYNREPYKHTNKVLTLVTIIQLAMTAWAASVVFADCPTSHLTSYLIYTVVYVWVIWKLVMIMCALIVTVCAGFSIAGVTI
jgi:hypothetical protein